MKKAKSSCVDCGKDTNERCAECGDKVCDACGETSLLCLAANNYKEDQLLCKYCQKGCYSKYAHFVRQDMKRNKDFKSMVFKTYEDTKSRICVYCGDNASNAELNNPNMRFCDALCQKNYYNK